MKTCCKCKCAYPLEFFSFNKSRPDGRSETCKDCINGNSAYKANKLAYSKTEKGQTVHLKSHLLKKFGLTLKEKQEMFDSQNGCCAICERKFKNIKGACVDHSHKTQKVRGLLCKPCNTFLGIVQENVSNLKAYVEKYKL